MALATGGDGGKVNGVSARGVPLRRTAGVALSNPAVATSAGGGKVHGAVDSIPLRRGHV